MKKVGILSLILYVLYTLCGGALAVYCRIAIDQLGENEGWNGLGLAIVMVVGMIVGAAGLVATILKLIHLKSGWLLFGLLCIAFDLLCIVVFLDSSLGDTLSDDILPMLPFIGASAVSLISNIISLKR